MAIFKRGKFYHIILEMGRGADGKRLQKSIATEFIRKADAENYEADLKRDVRQGSYSEPSKKTCNEFFEEWFIDRKNDIKLSSWQNYEWLWRTRVQPVIGHMLLASIRPVDIMLVYRTARGETKEKMPVIAAAKDSKATKRYPGAKLKKVLAQNTISKIHRFLHKAMGDAVRIYDIMPQNPMHRMVPPKKAHYEPVIYDVDMLKKLFSLLEGTSDRGPHPDHRQNGNALL